MLVIITLDILFSGIHGPFTFVVAFMSSLTLFGTLIAAGYFLYQVNMISNGRTSYELARGEYCGLCKDLIKMYSAPYYGPLVIIYLFGVAHPFS